MTIPKGTNMLHPVSDETFEEMTKGYSPEVKANKRAGLDFLNSVMHLNAFDAANALGKMKKAIDGVMANLALFSIGQSLSEKPADPTRPIGELLNEVIAKRDAETLKPKSKAEHESRNFETVH